MPRHARIKSPTNIYHVTMRSVNKQDIFEEKRDYEKYLDTLRECIGIDSFDVYAYCLMTDHIHLLICTKDKTIGTIVQRIASRFAVWYNKKYQRSGHLFQERFCSRAVIDHQYLMTVWRYILQNPFRAGMEKELGIYRWSSYRAYLGHSDGITTTSALVLCFPNENEMIEYLHHDGRNDKAKMELKDGGRISDQTALYVLKQISGCNNTSEFQKLDKGLRKKYIYELYNKNIPQRQITRITGISKTSVERVIRRREEMLEQIQKKYTAEK